MSSNNADLYGALSSLDIRGDESNNEETITICANCGKEGGDSMNKCNKCDLVKYCNAACKKKHRSKHKKTCEKRAAELYYERLFKEPPPPEECPICMLPPPLYEDHTGMAFHPCCGKSICDGCELAMMESGAKDLCAFCRAPYAEKDEEVERTKKLMKKGNGYAFHTLAGLYARGSHGLPQDSAKANELLLKAGELGCAAAYYNLGLAYEEGNGVEIDEKKAKHYYEHAAINGDIEARHNLGCIEGQDGNHQRAMKHFIIAARAGDKLSLDAVKYGYMDGYVTKEEYAKTLREFQKSRDEMKSDIRDKAAALFYQRAI